MGAVAKTDIELVEASCVASTMYIAPQLAGFDGIRQFEALCGFDPLASLGSISIGLKGLGNDTNVTGVIVVHGFEKTKSMSCFDSKGVSEAEKDGSKVTIDGDVVLITDATTHEHAAFTFTDNTTALIVLGPEAATKQGVEAIAAGDSGLQSSSAVADALQAINTDDSLWLVLADRSPLVGIINGATAPYTSIKLGTMYLSMNVTDTLALDTGLRLGSPATVAQLVGNIQAYMAQQDIRSSLSGYFDQLDVMADGSDLIVSLAMSGDQIVQLLSQISSSGNVTVGM